MVLWVQMIYLVFAASCNGVQTSFDYGCTASTNIIVSIFIHAINFLAIGVGILVVAGIVFGALQYSSANGNTSQSQEGLKKIRSAIIGLVIFIFMYAIMDFLVPGGAFNADIPVANVPTSPDKPVVQKPAPSASRPVAKSLPKLSDVYNFRDSGGTSGTMKSGILLRSGRLHDASSADTSSLSHFMGDNGVIIDLRDGKQRSKYPDKTIPGVSNRSIPIDAPDTGDYAEFVTNSDSRKGFGNAISIIANADGPVLIHCTYGKDRTGWLAAMVMYALGASNSQVMSEYMKSNADLPGGANKVKQSWLNAGLSAARKKYGSINNYITKGLGVSNATLTKLKAKLGA